MTKPRLAFIYLIVIFSPIVQPLIDYCRKYLIKCISNRYPPIITWIIDLSIFIDCTYNTLPPITWKYTRFKDGVKN